MVAIVAVDARWGIGRDNGLLFHISDDLKRFRALTEGKTVLMGRKTLQSLPGGRGLPRRRNVVLTGDEDFRAENAEVVHSAAEAVWVAGEDAWVIGGESVYRQLLPLMGLLEDTGELWQVAKYVMHKQGIGTGALRLPRGPISESSKAAVDALLSTTNFS